MRRLKLKLISRKRKQYRVHIDGQAIGAIYYDRFQGWLSADALTLEHGRHATKADALKALKARYDIDRDVGDKALVEVDSMLRDAA